jgi:hypothetical protein
MRQLPPPYSGNQRLLIHINVAMSKKGRSLPRYFFTTSWVNGIKEDPHGIYLVNAAAALSYAQRRIRELQNEGRHDHPGLTMIVTDEFRQTILSLPFPSGGA